MQCVFHPSIQISNNLECHSVIHVSINRGSFEQAVSGLDTELLINGKLGVGRHSMKEALGAA